MEREARAVYRVLLVDDDPSILETNAAYLKSRGYETIPALDAQTALKVASSAALDAIVLDVELPEMDGVEVCRRIREVSGVPIVFLSAYAQEDDRVRGLLAGGDDYVAKPYSLQELELRLRLRIQRGRDETAGEVLAFRGLVIDLGLREVRFGENSAALTSLEFDLLAFLARHPDRVFSYEELYDRVWKSPMNQGVHNMQVCMARVRQKLERLCPGRNYIETIYRKGYRFLGQEKTRPGEPSEAG